MATVDDIQEFLKIEGKRIADVHGIFMTSICIFKIFAFGAHLIEIINLEGKRICHQLVYNFVY